jgi:hypothetical protein
LNFPFISTSWKARNSSSVNSVNLSWAPCWQLRFACTQRCLSCMPIYLLIPYARAHYVCNLKSCIAESRLHTRIMLCLLYTIA